MCGGDLKAMSLLSHKVIIPRGLLYLSKVLCCFESLRIMHDLEIQTLCKLMLFYGASICRFTQNIYLSGIGNTF